MKVLLDTHALLWWLFDDPKLSRRARRLIHDPENEVLVSSASAWEIATKFRLGKLAEAEDAVVRLPELIQASRMSELPVTVAHALLAGGLRHRHRDPFDRMLAAQSQIEAVPILSQDRKLTALGAKRLW